MPVTPMRARPAILRTHEMLPHQQSIEAFQKNFPAWAEKQRRPGRGAVGGS